MEPAEEALDNEVELSENEASHACSNAGTTHSKRLKELENSALQTSLNFLRMESESATDTGSKRGQESGEEEYSNGLLSNESGALPPQIPRPEAVEESDTNVEEERTLTDHLNKRLLSSFLDKLNQRDLALPGIQRLDCAVADEDSNRAAEEW